MIFKTKYIDVILSQLLFFVIVFWFYNTILYSDVWSENFATEIYGLFCSFNIVDKKTNSQTLFSPHYNYPVGILILTVKNAVVQSVSYYIIKKIRDLLAANSF